MSLPKDKKKEEYSLHEAAEKTWYHEQRAKSPGGFQVNIPRQM